VPTVLRASLRCAALASALIILHVTAVVARAAAFDESTSSGCVAAVVYAECSGSLVILTPPSWSSSGNTGDSRAVAPEPNTSIPPNPVSLPRLVQGAGGPCVGFLTFGASGPLSAPRRANIQQITDLFLQSYALCPNAAVPAVLVSPAVRAARFWETIPLPGPKPSVPPGFAITGKLAYLVTNGTVSPPAFHQGTVVGALSISAHGSYQVDWGDGSASGPYSTEGLPYPNGIITHTYDNVGTYTLTVTETWTANWSLGTAAGTLQALHTEGVIERFPVQQLQAVITG
jgi:hypothetical protein